MRAYAVRPTSLELWDTLRREAEEAADAEPLLRATLHKAILRHESLEEGLAELLVSKLAGANLSAAALQTLVLEALADDPTILESAARDLLANCERDPACASELTPFLYFKGFSALQWYRVYHKLWGSGRTALADYLQSRVSEALSIDIHPGARLG
ncbi:MAG: serine O-acetyltransferase, partial [Vulcanimicrobiaceae bacterium]